MPVGLVNGCSILLKPPFPCIKNENSTGECGLKEKGDERKKREGGGGRFTMKIITIMPLVKDKVADSFSPHTNKHA